MPDESTSAIQTERPRRFPWRVLWLLLIASLCGAAAAIPLALEIFRPLVQSAPPPTVPLPLLVVAGVAQNLILFAVLIAVGLLLARKLGLGAPLLEGCLYHEASPVRLRDSLKYGAI